MISIRHLTKIYGTQRAIDDLSLEVQQGEILGFLGPNGAGKSTTMKILTGFLSPNSGEAEVDGFDVQAHPLEVRRRVGYLPEHNPLYLDLYVHEFLDLVGKMYRLDKPLRKQRIAEVIEQTGLGREQHKKIGMLSKGYRQRVGLSQALIHDPAVLILDEPTTGLDPNQIIEIRELIRNVGANKTVMFSSHILSEVEVIANRIVIINRGKIVADEPTERLAHLFENEVHLHVELEKPGLNLSTLQQMPGVKRIESPNETTIEIFSEADTDLRRALFDTCVQQDNAILGMNLHRRTLEETFRELTK